MKTRDEHLEWCKARAREYLDRGDAAGALASMVSDLGKNPETANHAGLQLGGMLMISGHLNTPQPAREFIEGFN